MIKDDKNIVAKDFLFCYNDFIRVFLGYFDKYKKESFMKRKLCLLLALLMMLSVAATFASCVKSEGDPSATTVTTLPQGGDAGNGGVDLFADLPTGNYEGYTFQFLNNASNFAITTIVPEDTADSLDAAIFARNAVVKEKLNVDIVDQRVSYAEVSSTVRSLTSSNDFEFDAVYNEVYFQTSLAQIGAYLPVSDLTDDINFDKPWWFAEVMDNIAIDDNGFEMFTDIQLMYYDSICGMVFNHQDFIDNKITFPYDMVRAGDWTIEEMEKIMKATYQKPGEVHGAVNSVADFVITMLVASDFSLVLQDDDEVLKIFDDETRFVEIYTTIKDVFYASNGYDKMNFITVDGGSQAAASMNVTGKASANFGNGTATFFSGPIGDIRRFRSCEFDYGLIPHPKYDGDQDQYISMVMKYAASLAIPSTTSDVERTSVILENLAAYSYDLVRREYYEVIVQGRMVRDNDSIEMIDIIFGHNDIGATKIELDTMYNLGLTGEIRKSISDCVAEIMVNIDGVSGTVESNIETMIEAYK